MILTEANTFLENNKMINIIFNYSYIPTYFPKSMFKVKMDFGK